MIEGYRFGVLKARYGQDFEPIAETVLHGDWIPSSSIRENGDFALQARGASVFFERLGIVATMNAWKPGAEEFFEHLEQAGVCCSQPSLEAGESAVTRGSVLMGSPPEWGVEVTRSHAVGEATAEASARIRVAVLDSGIDVYHEAFAGKTVVLRSFVDSRPDVDARRHGTACAGVICGLPVRPSGARYSVAPNVQLFGAKIFDSANQASDFRILAGIDWALAQGCQIVSMSVGRETGEARQSTVFDFAARAAMYSHGALLVAGVGNGSARPARIQPVEHPANCDHVLGVGAINRQHQIWKKSNGSVGVNRDQVDLVAPGVDILAPIGGRREGETLYWPFDGTSLATPFVSGIAALWAATDPGLRGPTLWRRLERSARRLKFPAEDAGAGLVQAPG